MSILTRRISLIHTLSIYGNQTVKCFVNTMNATEILTFKTNFTIEEQEKILNTLNDSDSGELSRFHISKNRIKNLQNWKYKKGPFRTLNDVLEVEGLGEKVLEKICHNIITENKVDNNGNTVVSKRLKQLITPPIDGSMQKIGIHLASMGISWAKLYRDQNKVTDWDYEDFSSLPKKMLPADTFKLALKVLHKLPTADIYILEGNHTISPQNISQSASVSLYTQHLELSSMLIALINTSVQHNSVLQEVENNKMQQYMENKVFHLRAKVPARLFRTLVGTEKVAALTAVSQLVKSDEASDDFLLPCTPISIEDNLRHAFLAKSSANKELLGQALMLVVSFMDLCIYKNPTSISALSSNKAKS
ncbi:hypothetical protein NQ317_010417 [Molorchus minor]|uniref:Transcription elongation factor, mitochondrial n=1 Tax=Molorchus minor TaxID=1323400 RepID=A0ABQ9JJ76_9CUCU|nr:hypothetical protein NQ317_010417 [Molorchus minor]